MNLRHPVATLGAAALVAAPLSLAVSSPASAAERQFRCGTAAVGFEVEREDGGRYEVDVDIDTRPGATFRVVLKQDGRTYVNRIFRADGEGDIDFDRNRPNTSGGDNFRIQVTKTGGGASCGRTITFR